MQRYPLWQDPMPDRLHISTQISIEELMLTGCTTTSDHRYHDPNDYQLDERIEAATVKGIISMPVAAV
jgi:hypothetical protein